MLNLCRKARKQQPQKQEIIKGKNRLKKKKNKIQATITIT